MDPEKPDEELIGVMPPSNALKPNVVDVFIRWIMNGMPQDSRRSRSAFRCSNSRTSSNSNTVNYVIATLEYFTNY